MSNLNQSIQKVWKSIVDLFEVSAPARAQATRRATTPAPLDPAAPDSGPAPVGQTLRLEKSQTSFLVMCASCTSLHELDAVCHRCGAPLCKDTRNCRLSMRLPGLGGSVFVCPVCRDL